MQKGTSNSGGICSALMTGGKVWSKDSAEHDLIKELLNELDMYKLLARDKVYPWILNKLVVTDVIARLVNNLWNTAVRGCSGRLEEKSSVLHSIRERDLGNYRPVSLSSTSGQVMKQIMCRTHTFDCG